MQMTDVFEWLESSHLAVNIRQSSLLFPAIEIIHIIGFVFLTGSAFLFDLRLLGVSRKTSVDDLARHLLPWSARSLLLVIPSGLLLFITQAVALSTNRVFGLKLILIFLAVANAVFFHFYTFRTVSRWNRGQTPPLAKITAVISLLLWIGVISCGRLIAYF